MKIVKVTSSTPILKLYTVVGMEKITYVLDSCPDGLFRAQRVAESESYETVLGWAKSLATHIEYLSGLDVIVEDYTNK